MVSLPIWGRQQHSTPHVSGDLLIVFCVRGPVVNEDNQYGEPAQRDLMREKIQRLLRAAAMKGRRKLVLSAFCGAFGNLPEEVAELFSLRRVLLGRDETRVGQRSGEFVGCFDEIVFAIKGSRKETLKCFQDIFRASKPSTDRR